jgi:hypothetical protein
MQIPRSFGIGIGFLILSLANVPLTADVILSEFLAINEGGLEDEDGDLSDWIELFNDGTDAVALEGYSLTDDETRLDKWLLPARVLSPGDYITVFASKKDRAVGEGEWHANFRLSRGGEYLALVRPDGTIAQEYKPEYPAQEGGFSYGVAREGDQLKATYFALPTPGEENQSPVDAPILAPEFSVGSQTFGDAVEITIGSNLASGMIRYTTDGALPTVSSPEYSAPLSFTETTHLRARVFVAGVEQGGAITSASYVKLALDSNLTGIEPPTDFTSDLPIIVLENYSGGSIPAPQRTFKFTHVNVFLPDPETGRSSLASAPDLMLRAGIRKRGQSSAGFSKPQYRLEIWDEHDEDFDVSLLGLPSESDWVLNGPWTDKSLIRNPLAFDLGRQFGLLAPRTTHFEMFLNTNGGDLTSRDYVGVYILMEKIKAGPDRVDITRLDSSIAEEPDVSGGYLMRFEPPGIISSSTRITGWRSIEILDPDPISKAQKDWMGNFMDSFEEALKGDNFADPENGYAKYVDVESCLNQLCIAELTRDQDAYVRSHYMHKDRGGKLTMGPLWDLNLILDTGCCFDNRNTRGWQYKDPYNRGRRDHGSEPDWWVRFLEDKEFEQKFIDRWFELRSGVLQVDNLFACIDAHAAPLAESAERNFLKWKNLGSSNVGFPTPSTKTWAEQIDKVKSWVMRRMEWIDSEFMSVPELTPSGGTIDVDTIVTAKANHTIYYTTDGSDPRMSGGEINPTAQMLDGTSAADVTLFEPGAEWKYLDTGTDLGSSAVTDGAAGYSTDNWKHPDYNDGTWQSGLSELGYGDGGTEATVVSFGDETASKFITTYFRKEIEIQHAGAFTELVADLQYDDGAVIYLNGKEVARPGMPEGDIEFQTGATKSRGGSDEREFEALTLDPAQLREGRNVLAVELHQFNATNSDISFNLGSRGKRLPVDANNTFSIGQTTLITARAKDGDDWSASARESFLVGATPAAKGNLVISQIMYRPPDASVTEEAAGFSNRDNFEFLQLENIGSSPINLAGVKITGGVTFAFPLSALNLLAPGSRATVVRNQAAFQARYGAELAVAGEYEKRLANSGDQLAIFDASGNTIHDFTYDDNAPWPEEADGGASLVLKTPSADPDHGLPESWRASRAPNGEFEAAGPSAFALWQATRFSEAELADATVSGIDADPDRDGSPNGFEFLLGTDPVKSSSRGDIAIEATKPNELVVTLGTQPLPSGVQVIVEQSTDLTTWTTTVAVADGNRFRVEFGDPASYWRVRLSAP